VGFYLFSKRGFFGWLKKVGAKFLGLKGGLELNLWGLGLKRKQGLKTLEIFWGAKRSFFFLGIAGVMGENPLLRVGDLGVNPFRGLQY